MTARYALSSAQHFRYRLDVDRWFLLGRGTSLNKGRPYVASTGFWTPLEAVALAYLARSGTVAAATVRGIEFVSSRRLSL